MPTSPVLRYSRGIAGGPYGWVRSALWFCSRVVAFLVCLLESVRVDGQLQRLPVVDERPVLPDWNPQADLLRSEATPSTLTLIDPHNSHSRGADLQPVLTRHSGTAPKRDWSPQWFPDELIYRSYLGSVREPRFACVWTYEKDQGWLWDVSLGGRFGLWRYGDSTEAWPNGWQIDMEGAAFPRLDPLGPSTPLLSSDFRFGIPITYGDDRFRFKTGYYHFSSHLGDEFMLLFPEVERSNYSRDAFILAMSYYFGEEYAWRAYAEVTWADWAGSRGGVAEPWEFLFGVEYSPAFSYDRGRPFWAINAHLREESKFGGHFSVQAGWQLPRGPSGQLFRIGAEYVDGHSTQASFFRHYERRLGFGLWYDY
jgi:hypothetical protein